MYFFKGDNLEVLDYLHQNIKVSSIGFNLDYTPYAKSRDKNISLWAKKNKIDVIAEEDYGLYEIFDDKMINPNSGKPYLVFTPFKKFCQNNFDVRKPDAFNDFKFQSNDKL